jgi:hypothetical protein
VYRLTGHSVAVSYLGHGGPAQDLQDGFVPLFHQPQLHKHDTDLPQSKTFLSISEERNRRHRSLDCKAGTGAASQECQAPTGANVSSMCRDFTASLQAVLRTACGQRRFGRPLPKSKAPLVTGLYKVAGAGFEPATFEL